MLKAIIRRLRRDKRGISNVIVVMLSLVLIVIIVSNVVLWSYQMNQLDWEKMQEKLALTNAERTTRSAWYTSQSEYVVNIGARLNGTYADTRAIDDNYETFREDSTGAIMTSYNPSGYNLVGSTKYVSGTISDAATDNGVYLSLGSYSSAFSSQTLYSHLETVVIAGTSYYQLRLNSSDSSGLTFNADASTTGRKLLDKTVYALTGITSIPASTWTMYYRAYKTGTDAQVAVHCDVDLIVRKLDGTIRTTIATDVANSGNLNRDSWTTVSGIYAWSNYTVLDDTDFLEVDYYAHVTSNQSGRNAYLRVDDSSLAIVNQTRITGVMLPSRFAVEVELTGSSNTQAWQNLTWTIDSAFTASNVNTTLQLYNYYTSQYPASGDGYIQYISNATPNTDEKLNQTITANSTNFKDPTGVWKVKITGAKDTSLPFDLKVDWVEFKVAANGNYRLDTVGELAFDLSTYPSAYVNSVEIQIRYRANDTFENWFLRAYNWTGGEFSDAGFNSTAGDAPTINFEYYAVNLTNAWQSYVQNGLMRIEFCDNNPDTNQTSVDVDFIGARLVIDSVEFSFENEGSLTTHVVAIWTVNVTIHERYDASFYVSSGERTNYFRVDISLPASNFTIKAITERGNTAVLTS